MHGLSRLRLSLFLAAVLTAFAGCSTTGPGDVSEDYAGRTPEDVLELEVMLTRAAHAVDRDEVARLLALGVDPDGISGTKARRYAFANGREVGRLGLYERATPLIALYARGFDYEKNAYEPGPDEGEALEIIRLLLAAGADLDIQDHGGRFVLDEAVALGHAASVKFLLDSGADPNLSRTGFTQIDIFRTDLADALSTAINGGQQEIIALLLEAGADVDDAGWGMTPLQRCAYNVDPRAMALLLAESNPDAVTLGALMAELIAAWPEVDDTKPEDLLRERADWFDCFRMLVERGATLEYAQSRFLHLQSEDIDLPLFQSWVGRARTQGLFRVPQARFNPSERLREGDVSPGLLKQAINNGFDPNEMDYEFNWEPRSVSAELLFGADEGAAEQLALSLLQAGLAPDTPGEEGGTLLHDAIISGQSGVVRELVANGANVNALWRRGLSPLDLSNERGDKDIIRQL